MKKVLTVIAALFSFVLLGISGNPYPSSNNITAGNTQVQATILPTKVVDSTKAIVPTLAPSSTPLPTKIPKPTLKPTIKPTVIPTRAPTKVPTKVPTRIPTKVPTKAPIPTKFILPTVKPVQIQSESYSGGDKDCKDFSSQGEAQTYFEARGGSPSNNVDDLDRDHDGLACESLR